ncbi:hypothetical protein [Glycomyces albidus]|uniref:Uncharacterized protein n=1 Tax=Glycomyces albidus TaxID=2656774 RepID=A0A6L5GH30_9ACTN|nr:hypothetical protein [Glycomyces albidus]MQM28980.1 hypothetical protein [Glycomyces albidus]
MASVRDLWFTEVKGPDGKPVKKKTKKHPDNGGNKDANRWQAVWIGPDGRECTKTHRLKEDAKNYGDDQEADIRRGTYISPADGKTKFEKVFQSWITTRKDPASVIRYQVSTGSTSSRTLETARSAPSVRARSTSALPS